MKQRGTVIISVRTWIGWSAALLIMGVTVTVFAFTTFSTKAEMQGLEGRTVKALDTITKKVNDIHEHFKLNKGE